MNYKYSPRSRRKGEFYPSFDSEGTPESEIKVQNHDEPSVVSVEKETIQPQELESSKNDDSMQPANADEEKIEKVKVNAAATSVKSAEEEKTKEVETTSRKSSSSKIDSGSLKRKIKSPLEKIKKMADNLNFKKIKAPSIPKYPFKKGEILLNEELKIGKLKESPKAEHREITSYVFKHQDSDESVDIVELEESPMESRRRLGQTSDKSNLVTPDEIIELPKRDESVASTIDSNDITVSESSSHKDEKSPRKSSRIHGYVDIEAYIEQITTDIEHVDKSSQPHELRLTRQNDILTLPDDPIFDEFSRAMNKNIKKSLSAQDEKLRQELVRRAPKIEEQSSEEDKLDEPSSVASSTSTKVDEPQRPTHHLLAPISSIDSTSSDEHSKAQLSILAEESESSDNKFRKSFETEASVDIEIESLKNDNEDDAVSDISTTLIEDEMKALEHTTIVTSNELTPTSTSIGDEKPTIAVGEIVEKEKSLGTTTTTTTASSGNEEEDENKLELESNQQTESVVKEDIIVKNFAEPATKISSRWSKIGFVFSYISISTKSLVLAVLMISN